jgi:hypothetical protein
MVNRTWHISGELAERVNETAQAQGLWPSDLVRWALAAALDALDAGQIEIPKRPRGAPFVVDWDRYAPGNIGAGRDKVKCG